LYDAAEEAEQPDRWSDPAGLADSAAGSTSGSISKCGSRSANTWPEASD
jgi:hypothetical protein